MQILQIEGKEIDFRNGARPSKRAVNMHARWAHKRHEDARSAGSSGSMSVLPKSVWSGGSWEGRVEEWLASIEDQP